jgi:hypothetical protein
LFVFLGEKVKLEDPIKEKKRKKNGNMDFKGVLSRMTTQMM